MAELSRQWTHSFAAGGAERRLHRVEESHDDALVPAPAGAVETSPASPFGENFVLSVVLATVLAAFVSSGGSLSEATSPAHVQLDGVSVRAFCGVPSLCNDGDVLAHVREDLQHNATSLLGSSDATAAQPVRLKLTQPDGRVARDLLRTRVERSFRDPNSIMFNGKWLDVEAATAGVADARAAAEEGVDASNEPQGDGVEGSVSDAEVGVGGPGAAPDDATDSAAPPTSDETPGGGTADAAADADATAPPPPTEEPARGGAADADASASAPPASEEPAVQSGGVLMDFMSYLCSLLSRAWHWRPFSSTVAPEPADHSGDAEQTSEGAPADAEGAQWAQEIASLRAQVQRLQRQNGDGAGSRSALESQVLQNSQSFARLNKELQALKARNTMGSLQRALTQQREELEATISARLAQWDGGSEAGPAPGRAEGRDEAARADVAAAALERRIMALLRAANSTARAQTMAARESSGQLERRLEEMARSLSALDATRKDMAALTQKTGTMEAATAEADAAAAKRGEEQQAMSARLAALEALVRDQATDLQQKIGTLRDALHSAAAKAEAAAKRGEERAGGLHEEQQAMSTRLSSLEALRADVDALSASGTSQQRQDVDALRSLRGSLASLEASLGEAQQKLQEEVRQLRAGMGEADAALQAGHDEHMQQLTTTMQQMAELQRSGQEQQAGQQGLVREQLELKQRLAELLQLQQAASVVQPTTADGDSGVIVDDDDDGGGGALAGGESGLSRAQVDAMIAGALDKYSADTIGMADYALRITGARILHEEGLTSPSYVPPDSTVLDSVFEILGKRPIGNPPEAMINPDSSIGNCWAFAGTQGHVTIKLAKPIRVTKVTLEHVHSLVAHDIRSAPKEFRVFGVRSNNKPLQIGGPFLYKTGERYPSHIQTFDINASQTFDSVQLRVDSNYGSPDYTCVYRFRVHGRP